MVVHTVLTCGKRGEVGRVIFFFFLNPGFLFFSGKGGGDVQVTVIDTSQDSKLVMDSILVWNTGFHKGQQGHTVSKFLVRTSYSFFNHGQNQLPFPFISVLRAAQLPVFKELNSCDFLSQFGC